GGGAPARRRSRPRGPPAGGGRPGPGRRRARRPACRRPSGVSPARAAARAHRPPPRRPRPPSSRPARCPGASPELLALAEGRRVGKISPLVLWGAMRTPIAALLLVLA